MPNFEQRDASDCGVTCLAYIFNHYHLSVSPALLRQKAGTDKIGTSALGLVETAKAFGLEAKGVKCAFAHLPQVGLPAIAHVVIDGKRPHFVVVTAVKKKAVMIMDPADGKVRGWTFDEFQNIWKNILVILTPPLSFAPGAPAQSGFRRLCGLLAIQKSLILQAVVCAVLTTILSLAGAVFVQKIIDNVIVEGNRNLLNLLGVSMVTILAVRLALGFFQSILMLRAAQKIDATIILGYYRHLLHLPQSFFDTMQVGEINSRISDAVQIRNLLNSTSIGLILNPLTLLFSVSAMFFYSWKLAALSLALIPLNGVIYMASDWRNKRCQRAIMERSADFSSQVVESMHAMPVVRGFQLERTMVLKIEERFVRLLKTIWNAECMGLLIGMPGAFFTQIYSILLLWIGASLIMNAELTVGQLMACQLLAGYVTGPIINLIGMNTSIRQAMIATDRLYEIIDLDREDEGGAVELNSTEMRSIRFESVCFRYPGRLRTLHDISLTINAGEIAVLTGPSGCGKSTLLALMHRLRRPESGKIFIGDTEIEHLRLTSLRRSISVLPQRVDLVSGTLAENLAPSDPNPDMHRLAALCREVGILEFVETLPNGFSTMVMEGGINFSGGQRQRIAIVRALYVDAPVLLLDEPNAYLDAKAADLLMEVLVRLRNQGKMIILAAHSRRIRKLADVIIVMNDGRIVTTRRRPTEGGALIDNKAGAGMPPTSISGTCHDQR
jgi:ABC-type bacteriocin/lantibiotic exporter with double-glycine peptidase domain